VIASEKGTTPDIVIEDMSKAMMTDMIVEIGILETTIEEVRTEVGMICITMIVEAMEAAVQLVVIHIRTGWMIDMKEAMAILAGGILMLGILALAHDLVAAHVLVQHLVEGIVFLLMVDAVDNCRAFMC